MKEEENVLPRSGAIALGGLTGLVFGIRGGFFKRLIYTTVGAGGMASLCYPKEAEEYFNEALVEVRKYGLIGHHLATSSEYCLNLPTICSMNLSLCSNLSLYTVLDDLRGSSSESNDSPKDGKDKK